MDHVNVRKRGRHVLVPPLARRINAYNEFDFDLDRAPCFSLVACLLQKDDGDDNAIAVCLWFDGLSLPIEVRAIRITPALLKKLSRPLNESLAEGNNESFCLWAEETNVLALV